MAIMHETIRNTTKHNKFVGSCYEQLCYETSQKRYYTVVQGGKTVTILCKLLRGKKY